MRDMTTSPLPFVSIITVNYNGARYLPDCLDSIAALDYPKDRFEVIVVDNASTDGSLRLLEERYPWVRVIENETNLGFSGGNNTGMREASGEFFALVNNDTVVDKAWLMELVRVALAEPRAGIVTSKILFKDRPEVINNAGSRVFDDGWGNDRGFNEEDLGQYDRVEEVFSACGASMLLRREMVEDAGMFDPDFFCYYEDTDLSWRARLRGWKVIYTHLSRLYHVHSGTATEWSEFFTFHVLRNRHFLLFKNAWPGIFLRSFFNFLRNTLVATVFRPLFPGRVSRNRNYYSPVIRMRVLASLVKALPRLVAKRRVIMAGRKVSDSEIRAWITPRR